MKTFDIDNEMQSWKVLGGTHRSQSAVMRIAPGDCEGGPHNRHDADQWLLVLSGTAHLTVEGETRTAGPHTLVLIEKGERHEVANRSDEPLLTLNVYAPPAYEE